MQKTPFRTILRNIKESFCPYRFSSLQATKYIIHQVNLSVKLKGNQFNGILRNFRVVGNMKLVFPQKPIPQSYSI